MQMGVEKVDLEATVYDAPKPASHHHLGPLTSAQRDKVERICLSRLNLHTVSMPIGSYGIFPWAHFKSRIRVEFVIPHVKGQPPPPPSLLTS